MAIEKNSFKVARIDPEFHSPHSRETVMSSEDDDDLQKRNSTSAVESDDDDDEFDDCDSGAGSDDFDLLELGETGEEFCQVGDQTCSIPYELYDLSGLKDVLSMEVWNEVLTEEERFSLSKYLPDMDQENFVRTLKELFSGDNLHFGSPVEKLFEMLKGGLCEPRVALYRQGLNFFQRRQHYHNLRKYQNGMVTNICQIRDAWLNCRGYSIEEKLRVLNIMKSQKSLMNENMEEFGSEPSDNREEESGNGLWGKKPKDRKPYSGYSLGPATDTSSRGRNAALESAKYGKKRNPKGTLKLAGSMKQLAEPFSTRMNEQLLEDDDDDGDEAETMFEVAVHRDRNFPRVGKKHEQRPRDEEEDIDSFMGMPMSSARNSLHALGRNKAINKLSDIMVLTTKPSKTRNMYGGGKKVQYTENLRQFTPENQMKFGKGLKSLKGGGQMELLDANDPTWLNPSKLNAKNKKWKMMGRETVDLNDNEYRAKSSLQNGKRDGMRNRGNRKFPRSEDTESDSSEHMDDDDDDDDDNPLMRSKWAYPSGSLEMMKDNKGKMHDVGYLNSLPTKVLEKNYFPGPGNMIGADNPQQFYQLGNGNDGFHMPSLTSSLRRRKSDFGLPQSNYMPLGQNLEDDLFWTRPLAADNGVHLKMGKKGQMVVDHQPESSGMPLMGCNSLSKKRKVKDEFTYIDLQDNKNIITNSNNNYLHADAELQLDDVSSLRKRGKNKLEDTFDIRENGLVSQPKPIMEVEMEEDVVEAETKKQKKSLPLITPTVHSGFSFSIIHLLSAVRMAMVTLLPEDSSEIEKKHLPDKSDAVKEEDNNANVVNSNSNCNVPSLTVQEIVNRVRSNPGDPCILETQEPLQDLIRGVLKIFSSRTAPLGAKGWKPLVVYEKSAKNWSWIGPVSLNSNSSDFEPVEEVTSPDSWGLPHKMLVKLVDSFANWLKNSQETLQQIGSLPSPPLTLMQINLDEKERFKDLRAQKSLSTISPSSEEVKAYFRKEEILRYLIPDRAYSYTAVDGKKSIVAPLRRCGGKPTSKARDHFMLKKNRPPHVTILCLVRDAAARLPGSIGTRADVCTLIRDSQYIVEDVSDAQVNQVVSGALDRLHYERDPCVQFDGERKLWVYLHREREEEDFEDDGTSSTKKWRRQKKEAIEPSEPGNDVGHLVSDLNVEANCGDDDDDKRLELPDYNNNGNNDLQMEDNAETSRGSDEQNLYPTPNDPTLKSTQETKLLCQENSSNEDLGEEAFGGEPPE